MRKIVAGFAASVDGYIEGPNGEYDWIIMDEKMDLAEMMKPFDAFFFGRRSYEAALRMGQPKPESITQYVFSRTLTTADKNFVLLNGDIEAQVKAIRQQPGKDIAVYGSANLLASLLNLKLVDEITISFIPVLLGRGKPMVGLLTERIRLTFKNSRRYENGTLVVTYSVNYNMG